MVKIITERLEILPMRTEELRRLADRFEKTLPELCKAYMEMLTSCEKHPDLFLWYTSWKLICKAESLEIGYAGFKGLSDDGTVEIGYGINEGREGQGYATEAVKALCDWALRQPSVKSVEAEAEKDNAASLRVLEKCGFKETGIQGAEGPRFVFEKVQTGF